jgi:hypothetical protein
MPVAYIEVYRGVRGKWQFGIHTSVYIEGESFEWTYSTRSSPEATHSTTYRGVIYERRRRFLYGDWVHWKSVPVGFVPRICVSESARALRHARQLAKRLVGPRFSDNGYHWLHNNCWSFCYALLRSLNAELPRHAIEELNDDRLGVWKGTTAFVFDIALRPLSELVGRLTAILAVVRASLW